MLDTFETPIAEFDVLQHLPALRALARALTRDRHVADDLVQETLLKAIASSGQFDIGSNLRAWLLAIMRNTYFTNVKRAAREQVGCADCIANTVSVLPTQEWTVRGKEVMDAIDQLPAQYREVIVLVAMLGENYADTARICGCPVGTVKSRLNRARLAIASTLDGKIS